MSTVAQLGVGRMGSALARAFLHAGHRVVVWNRTRERCDPLGAEGASVAASPAEALQAAELVVLCVADYAVSRELLDEPEARSALRGRTIVQLTTGTPGDARALAKWASEQSARYLDGALMSYPSGIGGPEAMVLLSGPRELFGANEATLRALGGNLLFISEDVGAASALDAALITHYYGATLAFLEGMRISESEGIPVGRFTELALTVLPVHEDTMRTVTGQIERRDYRGSEATVAVHAAAVDVFLRLTRESGMDTRLHELLASGFERAAALGHGEHEIGALYEALRQRPTTRTG